MQTLTNCWAAKPLCNPHLRFTLVGNSHEAVVYQFEI